MPTKCFGAARRSTGLLGYPTAARGRYVCLRFSMVFGTTSTCSCEAPKREKAFIFVPKVNVYKMLNRSSSLSLCSLSQLSLCSLSLLDIEATV